MCVYEGTHTRHACGKDTQMRPLRLPQFLVAGLPSVQLCSGLPGWRGVWGLLLFRTSAFLSLSHLNKSPEVLRRNVSS